MKLDKESWLAIVHVPIAAAAVVIMLPFFVLYVVARWIEENVEGV